MLNKTDGMEETQRREPQSAPEPSHHSVEHLLEAEHPGALILRHREEAKQIKDKDIAKALDLPPIKLHCSVLAEDSIKKAIENWEQKQHDKNNE